VIHMDSATGESNAPVMASAEPVVVLPGR